MNTEEEKEYRSLVRGVATYILLGDKHPPIQALELVQTFKLDLAVVNADIDAIVASERRKVGGVFEATDHTELAGEHREIDLEPRNALAAYLPRETKS